MELKFIEPNTNWIVYDTDKGNKLRDESIELSIPLNSQHQEIAHKMYSYIQAGKSDYFIEKGINPGVGIAAPQIGYNFKMTYISFPTDKNGKQIYKEYFFVNPKIIKHSEKICALKNGEGCLSIKNKVPGYVPRYRQITIKAYDAINEKNITLEVSGYLAIVFQHEIDHLEGILYPDRINQEHPWHAKKEWKLI